MPALRVALPLVLLAACAREKIELLDRSPGNGPDDLAGLVALRVEPSEALVSSDGKAPGEQAVFAAIGTFDDGSEEDLTNRVRWAIEDPRLGEVDQGIVTVAASQGGTTSVRAVLEAVEASAELDVFLDVVAVEPGTRSDASDLFPMDMTGDVQTSTAIAIIYPAAETVFPSNIRGVLHQWRAALTDAVFEVRFESSLARVRIYTRERSLQLDGDRRGWIARTHAGRSVTLTIRATSRSDPGPVFRSDARVFSYSRAELEGLAYYWSTAGGGLVRATLESVRGSRLPILDSECAGCHSVSKDGRRLAFGDADGTLRIVDLDTGGQIYPDDENEERRFGWGTFSPDGRRYLFSREGQLRLLDLETGTTDELSLSDGLRATQLDWSPDGRFVVAAVAPEEVHTKRLSGTGLARLVIDRDVITSVDILVASEGENDTLFAPSISIDGHYVAYARAAGDSKDNPDTELWLVASDGRSSPVLLTRLNREIGIGGPATRTANTMPTWAPTTDPTVQWLVFSSSRDYGDVVVGGRRDQLWGAAIDLDRIASGADPSFPAFWLPFQDPTESNHRATWVIPGGACVPLPEICDGRDDDCDMVTDNDCCEPAPETCGNGLDDDCDGAHDEGCGCGLIEICDNGLDDDCDGLTDAEDEDCDD